MVLGSVSQPLLFATIWGHDPTIYRPEAGYDPKVLHPAGLSFRHLLGTDPLGRDVLSIHVAITYRGMFDASTPWNVLLTGGLAITFLAGAFHLLSVGLRQVLDPTLKRGRA